jgi:hypothetical protein
MILTIKGKAGGSSRIRRVALQGKPDYYGATNNPSALHTAGTPLTTPVRLSISWFGLPEMK